MHDAVPNLMGAGVSRSAVSILRVFINALPNLDEHLFRSDSCLAVVVAHLGIWYD
jgi:hypothetical protein